MNTTRIVLSIGVVALLALLAVDQFEIFELPGFSSIHSTGPGGCGVQTGYRFPPSTDVVRKYNVPSETACCDHCSSQRDVTGWSWSNVFKTCICQKPPPGAQREAHQEYISGLSCAGGCSAHSDSDQSEGPGSEDEDTTDDTSKSGGPESGGGDAAEGKPECPKLDPDGRYPQESMLLRVTQEQKFFGTWRYEKNRPYPRPNLTDILGDHRPEVFGCVQLSTTVRQALPQFVYANGTIRSNATACIDECVRLLRRVAGIDATGCWCSELPGNSVKYTPFRDPAAGIAVGAPASVCASSDNATSSVFGTGVHKVLLASDNARLAHTVDFLYGHRPTYYQVLRCGSENVSRWDYRDINVIIAIRGRERNLRTTMLYLLNSAKQVADKLTIRIVVVELGNPCRFKALARELDAEWFCVPFQAFRTYGSLGVFSKSFAWNFAFTMAYPANWTLFHDADIPVETEFFSIIANSYLNHSDLTALQPYAYQYVNYLPPALSERIRSLALNNNTFLNLVNVTGGHGRSGYKIVGGSTLVRRDIFLRLGGFAADVYWGHAAEDRDFWARLLDVTTVTFGNDPPLLGIHLHHKGSEVDQVPAAEPEGADYDEYKEFCARLANWMGADTKLVRRLRTLMLSPNLHTLDVRNFTA